MYVLIAGAGELGRAVARLLRSDGHDVVLIEREAGAAGRAQALDVLTVEGNAASPRVLERANVGRAHMLYALTASDDTNLMACALARTQGVRTIARLNSLEYVDTPVTDAFKAIGVEAAVSVDMLGAIKLARLLGSPAYASVEALAEGRLALGEILVPARSPATNLDLKEVRVAAGSSPLAIVRGADLHFPSSDTVLAPGDRLLLLVRRNVPLDRAAKPFLPLDADLPLPPRRVMISGATPMGVYLARLLAADKASVRLVDADEARVRRATLEAKDAVVERGRTTERAFLEEENIAGFDAFVSVTDAEEYNILSALVAKQLGARRALAIVRQRELTDLAEAMGVDAAPSPALDGLSALYRFAHPLDPERLVLLSRGDGQVLEVVVREGARAAGRAVLQLALPKGASVGAVYRAGEALFPGEEGEIHAGDRLVIASRTSAVTDLKRWL